MMPKVFGENCNRMLGCIRVLTENGEIFPK